MHRRDRADAMSRTGAPIRHLPGGRGLGGGCWLSIIGLPRDWREMDVFRAMEKRYGKVNEVRRSPNNEREGLVQFVADSDAKFVWHMREIELYDRTCTVDVYSSGAKSRGREESPPPPARRRPPSPDRNNDRLDRGSSRQYSSGRNYDNGNQTNGNGAGETPLPEDDEKATRTLFIGNLESNVTEALLRSTFSKYGLVQDVDVKRPMGSSGNAYAFVRFLTLDMAYEAKRIVNGTKIGNNICKIGYGKTNPTTRVWVGQLHYPGTAADLDEARLFNEFDRFGQIKKIDYVRGEHYGYISFASTSASQEAVATMRGASFKINGDKGPIKVRLRVDYAEDDDPYLPKPGTKERDSNQKRRSDIRRAGSRDGRDRRRVTRSRSGSPPPREVKRRPSSPDPESDTDARNQKRSRVSSVSPPPKPSAIKSDDRKVREERRRSPERTKTDTTRRKVVKETIEDFRRDTEVVWKGPIMLKSTAYPVVSHLLRGPIEWLNKALVEGQDLQVTRRLRLEEEKLKDVTEKMNATESATLLCFDAPPGKGSAPNGSHQKTLKHLQNYLLEKDAAGVINSKDAIIYIFPTCAFANKIIGEDMPTLILPEKPENVKDENLGLLMIVSNPGNDNGAAAGGAE